MQNNSTYFIGLLWHWKSSWDGTQRVHPRKAWQRVRKQSAMVVVTTIVTMVCISNVIHFNEAAKFVSFLLLYNLTRRCKQTTYYSALQKLKGFSTKWWYHKSWGLFCFLFIFLERKGRREGEWNVNVRKKYQLFASHTCPNWRPKPQPSHESWLGIQPMTFRFKGRCSNQLSRASPGLGVVFSISNTCIHWPSKLQTYFISSLLRWFYVWL